MRRSEDERSRGLKTATPFYHSRCALHSYSICPLFRPVMSSLLTSLLVLALVAPSLVSAQPARTALLATLFTSTYDNSLRPLVGTGRAVVVSVNYRIDLLYAVSSADETYAVNFFLSERWVDPRLQFNNSAFSLPSGDILRLPTDSPWKPDTYFFNSIRCSVSDSLLKLDPTGSGLVTWTRHQTCTFYAPFDLQQFPFDSQALPIERLSFFYNATELTLQYSDLGCFQPDPRLDYVNALWDLTSYECDVETYNGVQGELVSWLYVTRRWQAYVLKMIVPMFLIVLVSALSYFVDPAAAPARVGLSVAIVLTVSTFNLLVSQDLPKINYSTLLDWYVWKCFLFVIAAVAEFAFVNHLLVSKAYPPLVARLVDDFFQWTVPVVWGLSNLIYWPILPSPAVDALFGVLMVAYIAANAYRIAWCYKSQKEGMVQPIKALYGWVKAHLDEADRRAREQIEKNSRHLARIGIQTSGSKRARQVAAGRGRARRGRGRGRRGGGGGVRGRDYLAVDADGEDGAGMDLSVIVTPPTPHVPHSAGRLGQEGHDRALEEVDEDEEEELELAELGYGDSAQQPDDDDEEDDEEVEEAVGVVTDSSGKWQQDAQLHSGTGQKVGDAGGDGAREAAGELSVAIGPSVTGHERLLESSADSSSQLRDDELGDEHDDQESVPAKHLT